MIVSIIGAGLMGHGIALTFSLSGHDVKVQDPVPGALDALHDRVMASLEVMGVRRARGSEVLKESLLKKDT